MQAASWLPVFERYETLAMLGRGGMAEVYLGRLRGEGGFEKYVALKHLRREYADDRDFVTMFLDEARLSASIVSPHVVSTHDLARTAEGHLYLVMDLVLGTSLLALQKSARERGDEVPLRVLVEMLAQAADGLHHVHEATSWTGVPLRIVHRDVSPDNILVGIDGLVRISDFGIARAVARLTKTEDGTLKGKFAYSAPEMLRGEEGDRRADVFSLGVVAWETVCRKRLFTGVDPIQTLRNVVGMTVPDPSEIADVPRSLSDVVLAALQRDPAARFATAGELARALRAAIEPERGSREEIGALVRAHRSESLEKLLESSASSFGPAADVDTQGSPSHSRPIVESLGSRPFARVTSVVPPPPPPGGEALSDAALELGAVDDDSATIVARARSDLPVAPRTRLGRWLLRLAMLFVS